MTRLVAGLAAAALLASPLTADAQYNRTVIRDSGNGVNNTIMVGNGPARPGFPGYQPAIPLYAPQGPGYAGYGPQGPVGYQPGFNPALDPRYGGPIGPGYGVGYGPGYGGNCQPRGQYPFGPGGFGVNVNVITNSGNGAGNVINTFNRGGGGPGGININVITNSGNGIGNTIGIRNR